METESWGKGRTAGQSSAPEGSAAVVPSAAVEGEFIQTKKNGYPPACPYAKISMTSGQTRIVFSGGQLNCRVSHKAERIALNYWALIPPVL